MNIMTIRLPSQSVKVKSERDNGFPDYHLPVDQFLIAVKKHEEDAK